MLLLGSRFGFCQLDRSFRHEVAAGVHVAAGQLATKLAVERRAGTVADSARDERQVKARWRGAACFPFLLGWIEKEINSEEPTPGVIVRPVIVYDFDHSPNAAGICCVVISVGY